MFLWKNALPGTDFAQLITSTSSVSANFTIDVMRDSSVSVACGWWFDMRWGGSHSNSILTIGWIFFSSCDCPLPGAIICPFWKSTFVRTGGSSTFSSLIWIAPRSLGLNIFEGLVQADVEVSEPGLVVSVIGLRVCEAKELAPGLVVGDRSWYVGGFSFVLSISPSSAGSPFCKDN